MSEVSYPAPVIILNTPQLAENIGAVARVMANFGLSDLRLVNPRDGWPLERAWASASGADWPLNAARVYDSVAAAIADLQLIYATTARPRELQLPVLTPRRAAGDLHAAAAAGQRVGLLFGGERAGLETQDIALCQAVVTIPIDPRFRSLNLAQAVAINAYEWRATAADRPPPNFREGPPPATGEALLGFYEHLERELETAGFFHPPEKTPNMIQNLRSALGRARFTDQEVRTLRGVVTALSRGRGKVLEKIARKGAPEGDG
ncbi:tRNA/rRNA methyltransferase [Phenylobacterium zucineum HLK1]|uniref:tRNA/rRNA methyltransferase n=1 Tax=Phenylobacterium zucineum (strain HLK1) TaxID=450851 RepID=B4RHE5_PHEZH|nr:RNA methyltransferase [Phenylobacterium zucineum]ACG77405.1 tRNA/rRNA methyltransferase [Phenylobacterium zucineum HLK1]